MLDKIKQFLKQENNFQFEVIGTDLLEYSLQNTEESYNLWKNGIFKFRNLNQQQINIIYQLYIKVQMDINYILQFITDRERLDLYFMNLQLLRNLIKNNYLDLEQKVQDLLIENINELYLIEKLILQGQSQYVCQKLISNNISQNLLIEGQFSSKRKFIKYFLLNFIQHINYFDQILKSTNYYIDLIDEVLFNSKLQINTEDTLFNYIKINIKNDEQQSLFNSVLKQWAQQDFIKFGSQKTQIYVTRILCKFIQDEFSSQLIHVGIETRLLLPNTYNLSRKCGLLVWKAYVKSLKIDDEYADEITDNFEYEEEPQNVESKQVVIQVPQVRESDDKYEQFDDEEQINDPIVKSLYDCVMALQSDDRLRTSLALKNLPYLIRNGLDLNVYGTTLCEMLMKMSANDDWSEENQNKREQSLKALMIMMPQQISELMIGRYYSEEASLGERHVILKLIQESVKELSDNPKKYPVTNFDQFQREQNQEFHFKKIQTTYTEDKKDNSKQVSGDKVRRWGHTKRVHDKLQIVESNFNRFHLMTQYFYFPLLVNAPIKHKLLLNREPILMQNFILTISRMLDCSQNNIHFIKLVQEAIDFLEFFNRMNDINIVRAKLQLWLKISILIKKDAILAYPMLIERILKHLDSLNARQNLDTHDNDKRHIYRVILQNFQELFKFDLY